MKYVAEISLSPKGNVIKKLPPVTVDKEIEDTTYDDVLDEVYKKMDEEFPEDCYPKADVFKVWVIDEDGEFPVVSESDEVTIKKLEKSRKYNKFLVLPDARYSLTDECKLFMSMKESGLIGEDEKFDFDKYHDVLEKLNRNKD